MLIGLSGGYVLLAVLIVPFMRNCGARTAAGFIVMRYGTFAGLIAAALLFICSVLFMTAVFATAVAFIARVLAADARIVLVIGIAVVLLCTIAGGMASVIASQAAQYMVLLIASLAVFFSLRRSRSMRLQRRPTTRSWRPSISWRRDWGLYRRRARAASRFTSVPRSVILN